MVPPSIQMLKPKTRTQFQCFSFPCLRHPCQQQVLSTLPQKQPVCFLLSISSSAALPHQAMAFHGISPHLLPSLPTSPLAALSLSIPNRAVTVSFEKSPLKHYVTRLLKTSNSFPLPTYNKNVLPYPGLQNFLWSPILLTSGILLFMSIVHYKAASWDCSVGTLRNHSASRQWNKLFPLPGRSSHDRLTSGSWPLRSQCRSYFFMDASSDHLI